MDTLFSRNSANSAHKTYIFGCYYIGTAKDKYYFLLENKWIARAVRKVKTLLLLKSPKTSAAFPLKQVSIFIGLHSYIK